MEIKIYLVPFALEALGKLQIIFQSISSTFWIYPYPQSDSIHTTISEYILSRSCLVVLRCIFVYASGVYERFQGAQIMPFEEEWLR
jgi:hypothetical protein